MSSFHLRKVIKKFRRGVTLFSLLVLSSFLILFSGTPGVSKPEEIGFTLVSMVQGGITNSINWVGDTFNSINELRILREEFEEAQTKLTYYEGIERNLVELKLENKLLRDNLSFSQSLTYQHIPAQIIAKEPGNSFSSITIDKGYMSGIRKDMPVIGFQDGIFGLVGKVHDVGLASAIVKPITDVSNFIAARFQNSRHEGLVVGQGNLSDNLIMQYVRKRAKDEIQFGDLVVTSGMKSLYPKGLYLGRVKEILAKDYETSISIELETVISFSKLEYLYVITGDQE